MNAEELYEEWTGGETSGMRPKRIQAVRDDLMRETGITVPRRISDIESWKTRMRGQVTKKLKEATGRYEQSDE